MNTEPYVGECVLQRRDDGRLIVLQAANEIYISEELVNQPECKITEDGILEIEGADRTVRYRIGEYFPSDKTYAAQLTPDSFERPPTDSGRLRSIADYLDMTDYWFGQLAAKRNVPDPVTGAGMQDELRRIAAALEDGKVVQHAH